MTDRPVLETIRALLKFKDGTTIAEVAATAGLKRSLVLSVINKNGHMVWRNRATGQITRVDPAGVFRDRLREAGAFFWVAEFDYGNQKGLMFKGHDELRERMKTKTWGGGIGDSYAYEYVPDTPDNRAALIADGCLDGEEMIFDDKDWQE